MCPPENSRGNGRCAGIMYEYYHGSGESKKEAVEMEVSEALASPASVRKGGKTFIQQMTRSFDTMSMFAGTSTVNGMGLKRPLKTFDERTVSGKTSLPSYMQETVSDRRDKARIALCATCGTPHELKACSRCRKIWYCGAEHQKQHWKAHKRNCVAAEAS
ncbi:hypothetical protein SISNIDRAFT_458432 [Sistotremastrum niveocremeum HHB9708]|uniref:MYND-type domain-containing protein n=1 Tax=Sistotremastrum niveocremeum HHB9708 TaxID=1314777 RepID=A0A164QL83_9AGAM|nr:hypothetical protein SISNIDRAFT_458432 [Sistotremastrum niveocremeum HHB9708]